MATIETFSDTFDRADGDVVGNGWTEHEFTASHCGISINRLRTSPMFGLDPYSAIVARPPPSIAIPPGECIDSQWFITAEKLSFTQDFPITDDKAATLIGFQLSDVLTDFQRIGFTKNRVGDGSVCEYNVFFFYGTTRYLLGSFSRLWTIRGDNIHYTEKMKIDVKKNGFTWVVTVSVQDDEGAEEHTYNVEPQGIVTLPFNQQKVTHACVGNGNVESDKNPKYFYVAINNGLINPASVYWATDPGVVEVGTVYHDLNGHAVIEKKEIIKGVIP